MCCNGKVSAEPMVKQLPLCWQVFRYAGKLVRIMDPNRKLIECENTEAFLSLPLQLFGNVGLDPYQAG